jgi:hypothetical protein
VRTFGALWRVVGIECAVDARKTAIARADLQAERLTIREATLCGTKGVAQLACDMMSSEAPTLFALDAEMRSRGTMQEQLYPWRGSLALLSPNRQDREA